MVTLTRIGMAIGAAASVSLTLYAGRHNKSVLLLAMFAVWVLIPFAIIAWELRDSSRWTGLTRRLICINGLVVSLASVATYGIVALGPPRAHTAFSFVVLPPIECAVLAIVIATGQFVSRKRVHGAGS